MARNPPPSSTSTLILYVLALFLPPLSVFLKTKRCGADFLINICLSILGWIPGVVHAWWVIGRWERKAAAAAAPADKRHEAVVVAQQPPPPPPPPPSQPQQHGTGMGMGMGKPAY